MSGLWVAILVIVAVTAWGLVLAEGWREVRALWRDEN